MGQFAQLKKQNTPHSAQPAVQRDSGQYYYPPQFSLTADPVQTKLDTTPTPQQKPVQTSTGGGKLPTEVQGKMEHAMGADFSQVNIHENSAEASNIGAKAYTQGNDIHFAPGEFSPNSQQGQELVGHELTHVVQQRNQNVAPTGNIKGVAVNADAGLESEADTEGKKAAAGETTQLKEKDTGSGGAAPVAQRDPNDLITTPLKAEGWELSTYEQIATYVKWCKRRLVDLQTELTDEDLKHPKSIGSAITEATDLYDLYNGGGEMTITQGDKSDMKEWISTFSSAMCAGQGKLAKAASGELSKGKSVYKKMKKQIDEEIMPNLRDYQRSAFRADDDSLLGELQGTVATAVDCSLTLEDVIKEIGKERAVLENMKNAARGQGGLYPKANSRLPAVMGILDKINKGFAAFALLKTGLNTLNGKSSTSLLGGAIEGVEAMTTIYGAAGTLLGASAGVTLYANLYLGPMVSNALAKVEYLIDLRSKDHNHQAINIGALDAVNWSIEPCGKDMFDYMCKVMKAGVGNAPKPNFVVEDYFMDHRDKFNEGTSGHGISTNGFIFEEMNKDAFPGWIWSRRDDVWGMLYGDLPVPN